MELARRTMWQVDLSRYSDPVQALEFAVSFTHRLAARLAEMVEQIPDDQLVYRTKTGEHLRGELTAAQRALADLRAAATDSLRLGLDARRIGVRQQTVDMLDRALDLALTASGIGFDRRAEARETFRKNITLVRDETA